MPRSYLSQTMPDKSSLSVEEPTTPTDSPKTAKQKKIGMRRSTSLRKSNELEGSSSGEEGDKDSGKEVRPITNTDHWLSSPSILIFMCNLVPYQRVNRLQLDNDEYTKSCSAF